MFLKPSHCVVTVSDSGTDVNVHCCCAVCDMFQCVDRLLVSRQKQAAVCTEKTVRTPSGADAGRVTEVEGDSQELCPAVQLLTPRERAAPPSVPPPSPTVKVDDSPAEASCSQLTQSCVPQFGCCHPQALCHCRFFNAICFCRRFNQGH
ncbi:hypothetical protein D4764_17G0008870 [Takifugu flavidus]|uniref:Agouti domain-containing protein n=1 Tax=Takifugu flavidus TaxID=433684 RepID=A0A5C6NV55_9TELE|nr:hypothetical protein D4764_17G0008870 [Takifugu flavidus]